MSLEKIDFLSNEYSKIRLFQTKCSIGAGSVVDGDTPAGGTQVCGRKEA